VRVRGQIEGAGWAGIVAGGLHGLQGVILLVEPRSGAWFYVVYSLFAGATLLTVIAICGLHGAQSDQDGRLGSTGAWVSSIGLLCLSLTAIVRVVSGRELLDLAFLAGFLLAALGYAVLGVAIFRARVLPRWSAPLPALGVVGAVVLQDKHGAGVVMGLVWALLGLMLLRLSASHS
jgi:hypothetical protein